MSRRKNKIVAHLKRSYKKIFTKNKKKSKLGNLFIYLKSDPKTFWVVFLIIGFVAGILFWGIFPKVFATESASIVKTSDTDFNQGTYLQTIVSGTGDSAYTLLTGSAPYPASGTWTSSPATNVIDLVFNGGWGDGTDDSTAFQAHVADVDTNYSIKFEMRVASTTGALATATWQELGTIDSGNTFTKTKSDLTALSLDEGTNRYVQVRTTLYSVDGLATPRLDDFTIYYLRDNDEPTENVTLLQAKNEEGGSVDLVSGQWYNYAHPYFQISGTDNCNPTPGCASGVTPCCSGIEGYWMYLGENNNGDPELLGTQTTEDDYIADGLVSGGTYYFRVKSYDFPGNKLSNDSILNTFVYQYDTTPPNNPSYILTPGDFISTKQFTFTWPVPPSVDAASDAHSGVAGYQYKINSCSWYGGDHTGDVDDIIDVSVGYYETTEEYDFSCLTEGTNYIYIRTRDVAGNFSTTTVEEYVRINTIAPGAPRNLAVNPSSSNDNSFSFSWIAPAGNPSLSEYRYSVNIPPSEDSYTAIDSQYTSLSAGPYATAKGANTFYIVAVGNGGAVNYGNYATITFNCNAPAPGPPKNLDIFDNSIRETQNYKIGLTWDAPDVPGTGFSGYKVYRSETESANCSVSMSGFTQIATTSGTSYVDSGLQSKKYYYCVLSYNNTNQNSISSLTVNLTPTGKWKTAPNLTKVPDATPRVKGATITWVTDRASSSFVKYGTRSQTYGAQVGSSDNVTSHSVSLVGLSPNTIYFYKTVWIDEDGNQGMSNEYSFTTGSAPTISGVSVSDISLNSAYLTFSIRNAVQAKIYYGKSTNYGGTSIVATSRGVSSYTVKLSSLDDDTLYHYMIELYDEEANKYQFEDHTFQTLPKPRVSNVQIQQVLDAPSPTLKISYASNTDISTIVSYYPEKDSSLSNKNSDPNLTKTHEIEISSLTDNTIYLLDIRGYDRFGNEAISEPQRFTTATDTRAPKISDFFVETKLKGQGSEAEVQIIVSWKTDEAATSQVGFGQGASGNYTNYTIEDSNMTTSHTVALVGLKPSSIYHLMPLSYDGARNKAVFKDSSVFTPKATESAIDLIVQSLKEIFGLK